MAGFRLIVLQSAFIAHAIANELPPPASLAPHPRLLTTSQIDSMKGFIANGGDAASFATWHFQHAAWVLTQPVVPRPTPGPTGVLVPVRQAMDFLLTSALAHRLNNTAGKSVYLDRAIAEGLNLAVTWVDWNTLGHALDTGEALLAVGLAYDWLYTDLNETTRGALMSGIVTKGLEEYKKYIGTSTFFWMNHTINWNCVCSGGGITAVLATYGDAGAPSWAWDSILSPLVEGVRPCVGAYNVDSSWEEGPGYWGYASKYNAWMFSGLQSVLNTTYGLTDMPGIKQAAQFPIYSTGADALSGVAETYDWADSHSGQEWYPFSQWWGSAFGDGAAAFYSRLVTNKLGPAAITDKNSWAGLVESLYFFTPLGSVADVAALPTGKLYDYINVGTFRGPWNAPAQAQNFLSFKGGNNGWTHGHLDLGSFVYDFQGQRFAEDMGGDSYELPGYFDNVKRWTYYRMSSRGHNLPMFGNVSQAENSVAMVTGFNFTDQKPVVSGAISVDGWAIVNLTEAYALSAGVHSYNRGFLSVTGAAAVIIVDEWSYNGKAAPSNMTWQLHTQAVPAVTSPTLVTLTARQGGPAASMSLLGPASACAGFTGFVFTDLAKVLPDPPFDSAAGYSRVDAVVSDPASASTPCTRLAIAIGDPTLSAQFAAGAKSINPLAEWATRGPIG